jgi:hypothetical protein
MRNLDRVEWPTPPSAETMQMGLAAWHYTCNPSTDAIPGPFRAAKIGVAQEDSFKTFLAGAFLALAATALMEAAGIVFSMLDRRFALRIFGRIRSNRSTGGPKIGAIGGSMPSTERGSQR